MTTPPHRQARGCPIHAALRSFGRRGVGDSRGGLLLLARLFARLGTQPTINELVTKRSVAC